MLGPRRFRFLNVEKSLVFPAAWNGTGVGKLWLYNLHYFQYLNSTSSGDRSTQHKTLIDVWITDNSPTQGIGWESYPLSLRIVNWIKYSLAGGSLSNKALDSLCVQSNYLASRIEYHLLGNHLLANAKALVLSGLYFESRRADRWFRIGIAILERELNEQILPDGGHFERSPMYHALVLEDMLDLVNVFRTFGRPVPDAWLDVIWRMRNWLKIMTHPDGGIAFFNDAALGIASSLYELEKYAHRLEIFGEDQSPQRLKYLETTGYVRVETDQAIAFLDVAPLGPDYLPAHGHADTLSFELSCFGRRILVNSGTSEYRSGNERMRQRGTAVHNTLSVDGKNSSDVWASFRVGSRAHVFDIELDDGAKVRVAASHDGYARLVGRPIHRREWVMDHSGLQIQDTVDGRGYHKIIIYFHLYPGLEVCQESERRYNLRQIDLPQNLLIEIDNSLQCRVEDTTFHPEFGSTIVRNTIVCFFSGPLPVTFSNLVIWSL